MCNVLRHIGTRQAGSLTFCCLQYLNMSSVHNSTCFSRVSLTGCNLQTSLSSEVYSQLGKGYEMRHLSELASSRKVWRVVEEEGEVKVGHVMLGCA